MCSSLGTLHLMIVGGGLGRIGVAQHLFVRAEVGLELFVGGVSPAPTHLLPRFLRVPLVVCELTVPPPLDYMYYHEMQSTLRQV